WINCLGNCFSMIGLGGGGEERQRDEGEQDACCRDKSVQCLHGCSVHRIAEEPQVECNSQPWRRASQDEESCKTTLARSTRWLVRHSRSRPIPRYLLRAAHSSGSSSVSSSGP